MWTDFAAWVREKSGRLGSLLIAVGKTRWPINVEHAVVISVSVALAQLVSGDSDELGDHLYSVSVSRQSNSPSQEDQEKVKRELTES